MATSISIHVLHIGTVGSPQIFLDGDTDRRRHALSLLLPGRLDLARPADRRFEWSSAGWHSGCLPLKLGERPRLGIAQMTEQRNPAPVETHQRGAGHIHDAGIFAPYQQAARLGTRLQRSEEHTSELQSLRHLVCRLLLEKK